MFKITESVFDATVSTVLLYDGMYDGMYETCVFYADNTSEVKNRYLTKREAIAGHCVVVDSLVLKHEYT